MPWCTKDAPSLAPGMDAGICNTKARDRARFPSSSLMAVHSVDDSLIWLHSGIGLVLQSRSSSSSSPVYLECVYVYVYVYMCVYR